ncbi:hypothetical protein Leryth_000312 [Lithospermum erythrorhizon]|uniref:Uncharacterized protein n=1 Tax=Lithospermum erythrorhizon TaxID=34254 RepID=A0AAV3RPC7_LITER|nr:hypothetical protein Leryth_000312 [Lithospermum erythrorhizon]
MAYFSSLGISLSFVFGFIFLGLVAELYYVLYWKKRIKNREQKQEEYTSIANEIPYIFCWKHPNSLWKSNTHQEQNGSSGRTHLEANGLEKDLESSFGEDGIDLEIMRLHNLAGPPRFLFPIIEESKEDLESEDGRSNRSRKGSRTRSLSDVMITVDNTILFTPMSSPPIKIPRPLDEYSNSGFNPLFESISEGELNRLRSSPPPKFKFLRDAEEKLMKKLIEETEKKRVHDSIVGEVKDGSFLSFLGKNRKKDMLQQLPLYCSTPSKVLPLDS